MVSICIPTSDMAGRNVFFLKELMSSIGRQIFKRIEIIVSDNSSNEEINFLCLNHYPSVRYFRNQGIRTAAVNLNNAISKAKGDIIKPMFLDDYFVYPDTLNKFNDALINNHWAFCNSEHKESKRGTHEPYINNDLFSHDKGLAEGCNTYGCPSAMAFRRTVIQFDEELKWLLDCDFYVRMQMKYGLPVFVDSAVNIREWEGQESKKIDGATIINERNYVIRKYAQHL